MIAFRSWPVRFGRFSNSALVAAFVGFVATIGYGDDLKNVAPMKVPVFRVPIGNDWKIEIIPGPAIGPSPVPKAEMAARKAAQTHAEAKSAAAATVSGIITAGGEDALPAGITPAAYSEVYNSIPFRRSEYLANASYRHEATIELLLGQVRPKTITNVSAPAPTCCSPRPVSFVGLFNPWGAKNFYYHYSYSRPTSYWLW